MADPIKRMTEAEQSAYRKGVDDALVNKKADPRRHDIFDNNHRETYFRGYRNTAGELND